MIFNILVALHQQSSLYTGFMYGCLVIIALLSHRTLAVNTQGRHECQTNQGVTITEDNFGTVIQPISNELQPVRRFTLRNIHGVQFQVITYGATATSVIVPDKNGNFVDVLLGFDNIDGYTDTFDRAYFGATLGRVCNRIGHGEFTLNGVLYNISRNENGENTLHGGFIGYDKFNWAASVEGNRVVMSHVNPDKFQGFPGTVTNTVTFELNNDNQLSITYEATTTEPTPINLSNHMYFNLAGHGTGSSALYSHFMMVNANQITETDSELIPTGNFINVTGTAYDLRTPQLLQDVITSVPRPGLDDNYCVTQTNLGAMNFVGSVNHPESGRSLDVFCDQPGVQVYTSNNLPDPENNIYPPGKAHLPVAPNDKPAIIGKGGALYEKHGAFCLETLKYPDAVNHPNFPSTIVNPGEHYSHHVLYKFGIITLD